MVGNFEHSLPFEDGLRSMPIPALQSPNLGVESSVGNHLIRGVVPLEYALRRLSSFVSLEFTKNVRCAVLLIRYAVPALPHNQHVRSCKKVNTTSLPK